METPSSSDGEEMEVYSCFYCNFSDNDKRNLVIHIKRHISEMRKDRSCDLCSFHTNRFNLLSEHLRNVHGVYDRDYNCHLCDFETKTLYILKRHFSIDHSTKVILKVYKCMICRYRGASEQKLIKHTRLKHSFPQNFRCAISSCKFKTKDVTHYLKHANSNHNSQDSPTPCVFCDFKSPILGELNHHIRLCHSDGKPYVCFYCNYQTQYKMLILKHIESKHLNLEKPVKRIKKKVLKKRTPISRKKKVRKVKKVKLVGKKKSRVLTKRKIVKKK